MSPRAVAYGSDRARPAGPRRVAREAATPCSSRWPIDSSTGTSTQPAGLAVVRAVPDLRQRPAAAGAAAGRPAHEAERFAGSVCRPSTGTPPSVTSTTTGVRLVGNRWRYHRLRRSADLEAGGDEQPLDAAALTEALITAYEVTGDARYAERPDGPSAGSSAGTGSALRCTTSAPVAATTGWGRQPSITTRGPSRRSPSSRPIWPSVRRCPSASPSRPPACRPSHRSDTPPKAPKM